MVNLILPAMSWLGCGIDMTSFRGIPIDIDALAASTLGHIAPRFLDPGPAVQSCDIGGVMHKCPKGIFVTNGTSARTTSKFTTFRNGLDVVQSFLTDPSLYTDYFAVTGGGLEHLLNPDVIPIHSQHGIFASRAEGYRVAFNRSDLYFNETWVEQATAHLPVPFDRSSSTLDKYKLFFSRNGSHLVVAVDYGAKFVLWDSAESVEIYQDFPADVLAFHNGIPAHGNFDASIKTTTQYLSFLESVQGKVSVVGGDPLLARDIAMDQTNYEKYVRWADTMHAHSQISRFEVAPLWELMRNATSRVLRDRADALHNAYLWLSEPQRLHHTRATLHIDSEWAEFGLISPNVVIMPKPPYSLDRLSDVNLHGTKLSWYGNHSTTQIRIIHLTIVNDGSPIDFYLSYGYRGNGSVALTMESATYVNDHGHDNIRNTRYFFQAPVSHNIAHDIASHLDSGLVQQLPFTSYLKP